MMTSSPAVPPGTTDQLSPEPASRPPSDEWNRQTASRKQGWGDYWNGEKESFKLITGQGNFTDWWHAVTHSPVSGYVGVDWDNKDLNALFFKKGMVDAGVATFALGGEVSAAKGVTSAANTEGLVSATEFVDGGLFEATIGSEAGSVGVLAETSINGGTLTLSEVAVYGQSGPLVGRVGASSFLQARTQVAQMAANAGFDILRITGVRVSGSSALKPGTVVDWSIPLAPYK